MLKIYADIGTSWAKIIEIFDNVDELTTSQLNNLIIKKSIQYEIVKTYDRNHNELSGRLFLLPTNALNNYNDLLLDGATGHMSANRLKNSCKCENELVAMALGAIKKLDETSATLVDLGSRDSKWIRYNNKKYQDLDWNGTCGSGTGATIEMVCRFYNVNPCNILVEPEKIAVTCGVFGMEKIMDLVARGTHPDIAISRYIHGIAFNVWNFARCPEKIYLSGGLCLNNCFINSLKLYCEVIPLGRFVLLEGLY